MSKISSIYLSKKETERLEEVCKKEGCKPYSLVKRVLLDHLWAYPDEKHPATEKEGLEQDLGEPVITDAPEVEPSIEPEEVAERVRKILEEKDD